MCIYFIAGHMTSDQSDARKSTHNVHLSKLLMHAFTCSDTSAESGLTQDL